MKERYLNIAAICESTQALGPGNRFVIWVQGCTFNCFNCETPEFRPLQLSNIVSVSNLIDLICSQNKINGLTISGGEPFLQGKNLTYLIKKLKSKKEFDIIVYTGYEYKDLIWGKAKQFLRHIDVLISGKYIDKLNNNKGLRGSTNQEIIFLTNKLTKHKNNFYNQTRKLEYHINDNEIIRMIGIAPKNFKIELNNI